MSVGMTKGSDVSHASIWRLKFLILARLPTYYDWRLAYLLEDSPSAFLAWKCLTLVKTCRRALVAASVTCIVTGAKDSMGTLGANDPAGINFSHWLASCANKVATCCYHRGSSSCMGCNGDVWRHVSNVGGRLTSTTSISLGSHCWALMSTSKAAATNHLGVSGSFLNTLVEDWVFIKISGKKKIVLHTHFNNLI